MVKCSECGYEKQVRYSDIGRNDNNRNVTKTCAHLTLSGEYIQRIEWENKKIRHIFNGIKQRCYNKNDKNYRWYGAKGIKICNEWLNNPKLFEEWALHNGYVDGLTINRIDENKGYSPDNCEWITNAQNSKYKSTTSIISIDGEVHSGRDWSKILGLGENRINTYVRQYGLDNTIEFIKRYLKNPNLKPVNKNKNIYSVYMD